MRCSCLGTLGLSADLDDELIARDPPLQQVQPVLATLTQLERDAQCSFFDLQRRFGGAAASA